MAKIKDVLSLENFEIEEIDLSFLNKIVGNLPTSGVIDLNIAERGLIFTLEGQNFCQDKIALIDRYIGLLESDRNKAWSSAALSKAKDSGHKTSKDKEWFAQSDDDYISACNKLTMAKATKKWFENKASYFSGWHYTFKTFLKRDYSIESSSDVAFGRGVDDYRNIEIPDDSDDSDDTDGKIDWE